MEPTAVMPLLKDAPASSDDSEKIMANLEKNVRVVLSTSLVDHEMEALRLRMFLQKIEHGIAECRCASPLGA